MRVYTFIKRFAIVLHTVGAIAIFAALCGLFVAVMHPWLMNWGSTRDEQAISGRPLVLVLSPAI